MRRTSLKGSEVSEPAPNNMIQGAALRQCRPLFINATLVTDMEKHSMSILTYKTPINFENVSEALELALATQGKVPGGGFIPFWITHPGDGKTQLHQQFCDQPSATSKSGKRGLLVSLILSRVPSVDIAAIPVPDLETGKIRYFHTGRFVGDVPNAEDYDFVLVFIDELPNSPDDVQVAFQSVAEDRESNGVKVADNVIFAAAGNPSEDNCGAGTLVQSLLDRLCPIYGEVDLDGWCEWAEANGVLDTVVQFNRWKEGTALQSFDPDAEGAQASPRGWVKFSDALKCNPSPAFRKAIGEGYLGAIKYNEFAAFEKLSDVVSIVDVLSNPEGCPVPLQSGADFAVAANLISYVRNSKDKLEESAVDSIIVYLDRLPESLAAFGFAFCHRANPLFACSEKIGWFKGKHATDI